MVIRDLDDPSTDSHIQTQGIVTFKRNEADPFDRFAAHVLDFGVVILPVGSLLLAPLTREISEFYLMGEWTNLTFHIGWIVLFASFGFCLYHGLTEALWGQSFGKKIMGLKVLDLWTGNRPSIWKSFFRSFYVLIQFVFMGFPFLQILANPKHRGIHDQLTDTWVVSLSGKPPAKYRAWPVHILLRGSMMALLAIVIPVSFQFMTSLVESLDLDELLSRTAESEEEECSDVPSLEEGMSLVATGVESIKCLRSLADSEFVEGSNPSALAYLVKSFLYVDQAELSDKYLSQVCKTEAPSPACHLSQVISAWSSGDIEEIETVLESAKELEEPFLDLWALRYFQQSGHFQKSIALSEKLEAHPYVKDYVLTEKAKAHYLLGQIEQSESLVERLQVESPLSAYTSELVSWSCQRKLDQSCQNSSHELCENLARVSTRENLGNPQILLGKMRLQECQEPKIATNKYLSDGQPEYWREFLYGLRKQQRGDLKSAWSVWASVVKDGESPDYLKAEAIRRMTLSPEISEIESLTVLLSHIESFEYKKSSSIKVAEVFRNLELMDLAKSVDESANSPGSRVPASVELKESEE